MLLILCAFISAYSIAEDNRKEVIESFSGSYFMILVGNQEAAGKKGFHLKHDKPKKTTQSLTTEIAGYAVKVEQFPFEPDMQTILYRFSAEKGKEKREIKVLYNGMLSFTAASSGEDGMYFYVAEEYQKTIRYYAIYKNEPDIDVLKILVEKALLNPDSALVATRWAGKESEIFIYDSSRLTK